MKIYCEECSGQGWWAEYDDIPIQVMCDTCRGKGWRGLFEIIRALFNREEVNGII